MLYFNDDFLFCQDLIRENSQKKSTFDLIDKLLYGTLLDIHNRQNHYSWSFYSGINLYQKPFDKVKVTNMVSL